MKCSDCAHWRPIRLGYGECHAVTDHVPETKEFLPPEDGEIAWVWTSVMLNNTMYKSVQDGVNTDTSLITKGNFGCVLFEEGPNR